MLHDMVIDTMEPANLKTLSGLHCSFLSGWSVPVQPGSCPFHRHRGFEIVYHGFAARFTPKTVKRLILFPVAG